MRLDLAVKAETKPYQGLLVTDTTKVRHGGSHWMLYLNYDETKPSGGEGYPFDASAEKGKIVLDRMVEWGVEVINSFKAVNSRPA